MSRDNQKSKVYAAGHETRAKAEWFHSLAQAQALADKVTASPNWNGPKHVPIKLARRDSWTSTCHCKGAKITLSPAAGVNDFILLHELAHAACWTGESHGPEFCAVWLGLVREHLGGYKEVILRQAFDRHGVNYKTEAKAS